MHRPATFDILTIFPDLLQSPLGEGIIRQAINKKLIEISITNLRDFTNDKHQMTDDRPFGGGEGMVMKPEPLAAATKEIKKKYDKSHVVLLSPQGAKLDHSKVIELANTEHLILVCGRYEGLDERHCSSYVDEEISIGDYILSGGELGAMVIIDTVTRMIPGVLGCTDSADKDTFSRSLLKHSQYTRPREFDGEEVPKVLLSGDHSAIEEYRFVDAVKRTLMRRPDLLEGERFSKSEVKILKRHNLFTKILSLQQGTDDR